MNIGIYIYDDAEVLYFSGPFEVFSTAKRIMTDRQTDGISMADSIIVQQCSRL